MPYFKFDKNKKRLSFIIIISIAVILISLGGWFIYKNWQLEKKTADFSPAKNQEKVLYIINKGGGDINEYQAEISGDSTVYSLLEELAKKEKFTIEINFYPEMGIFVRSISEAKGGTDNKWWQYWVNGTLSDVAADKKQVKNGDKIEWKFEVAQF